MKKSASTGGGSDVRKSSSESKEAEAALKEEVPSSSSSSSSNFPEELQGFTSASEIYSVRSTTTFLFFCLQTIHVFFFFFVSHYSPR